MNRKGQVQDLVVFLVTLFSISIFASLLYKIGSAIKTSLLGSTLNDATTVSAINSLDKTAMIGDTLVGFVMLGLFLVLTISAILVPTNIVFTVLFLAIGALLWFISIPLSNAYKQFATSGAMLGISGDMPLTYTIMTQLPVFATITLVLLIVILYGKRFIFAEGVNLDD
jgi:hypothetical protein|tara:strand:- start:193 stop:699 length:507 start_codon:yes stop_codon:yes gene_type:complete